MPLKKKIPIIIALVVIFIVAAVIFGVYKQQKELAAVRVKCLEDTDKLNDEQIVEKINNLVTSQEELSAINRKTVSYLFCNFLNSDKSERIYQEIQALIQKLKLSKETSEGSIKILTDYYSAAKKDDTVAFNDFLTGMLAIGDLTEICPNRLPDVCAKTVPDSLKSSSAKYQRALAWCKDACNLIAQYSENKDKLETEVINFKEWDKSSLIRKEQYNWRTALAYRFGGKEEALKVCNNLATTADREDCIARVNNLVSAIAKEEEAKRNCANQRKELENLICSVSK